MRSLRVARLTIAAACLVALSLPARALASSSLQTSLIDDQQLIYDSPSRAISDLKQLKSLGVDQVKVSVVWGLVAPTQPSDPTDPGTYPPGAWNRYDRIVREASQLGLGVYFMFVPPAPDWAIPNGETTTQGERLGLAPSASDFGQFVEAAGQRYSGSYNGLPRVSYWSVWNEPDLSAWLNPWHRGSEALQPPEYRSLVNAAWRGLAATGHTVADGDTILIGELANSGYLPPLQFVRGLYCVSDSFQPLTGTAASHYGCPRSGSASNFAAANPGLFQISGFAHHPYSFNAPPDRPYFLRNWITMSNLGLLEHDLNGIFSTYGELQGGAVPLYLTEFGYESNPPNPYVKNSAVQQAAWINEAEYMAWSLPYVRTLNQFELIDSRPLTQYPRGSRGYWGGFMTGLEFVGGKPKPALPAFRLPLWLPSAQHGPSVTVWGQLRPADHTQPQFGLLEFEPSGSSAFQSLGVVSTVSQEGFFLTHVSIPSAGLVQLAWLDPSGTAYYSRPVRVS